jgi:hypothetical protein
LTQSFDAFHLTNVDISDKTPKDFPVWLLLGIILPVLLVITGILLARKYVAKLLAAGKM